MGILVDFEIRRCAELGMIEPFVDSQVREFNGERVISYGLSSCGYDVRLADEILKPLRFDSLGTVILDPRKPHREGWLKISDGKPYRIDPGCFILGRSVEYIRMPIDVIGICVGKSTYARCGVLANITPLEPGWEGFITLELSNTGELPVIVYPNMGIAQVVFHRTDHLCERPYTGRYQKQSEVTLAHV